MSIRYQAFTIAGVANVTTFDTGLESTQAEPKKLLAILVNLSGYAANFVQLWKENEKIADAYDYHFQTEASSGSTNVQYAMNKLNRLDLELDIPVGERVKAGLKCGATTKNLFGCYVYDVPD